MKLLKKLLVIFAGFYILLGLVIFVFQRKFIYFPTPLDFNNCTNLPFATPVFYQNTRMYVRKSTNNWIIIYHGNAGSACDRAYYLNYFDVQKYSYIIVEYTGYSNDKSSPNQQALMKNVESVSAYVKTQNPSSITVIGESLGTALASYHSYISPPNKLLLISPFDTLEHVSQMQFWFYPTSLMIKDKYPSNEWLKKANNVLFIQGTEDSTINPKLGKVLFNEVQGPNKQLVEIPGASHNNIYGNKLTIDTVKNYIK